MCMKRAFSLAEGGNGVTYRLFAALDLPDDVADLLTPLQRGLDGASWRPRENFHVTLRFFGEIDGALARDLDLDLGEIRGQPFEIALKGVGSFGGDDPHAVWAGIAADDRLKRLASACDRAARRVRLPRDRHPFRPHVTLAYLKGVRPEAAAAWCKRFDGLESEPFRVTSFSMYSSRLGKGPSRYVEEAVYPLFGGSS